MKVKINHTLFITLSLITLLIAGNYWGIAQFVLPYKARLYILVLSGAIPLLLALIGRKDSTWLYILHPIFITCIGMVAHKVGVYGIYKFIAPIVVYITTLIFLMIVDKIKMAAVIDR